MRWRMSPAKSFARCTRVCAQRARSPATLPDRIRIGSLYSLTSGTVPALIMGLKLRKPDLQTELVLGSNTDLLQRLRAGTIDATLMGTPEDQPDLETQLLFEDEIFFAAPKGSAYEHQGDVDLAACGDERFVSLTEGFVTFTRFMDAFRVAGFMPNVVIKTGDIFSLMNLVGGGIGCTLLPGRIRSLLPAQAVLVPLQPRYRMLQRISLTFLRTRERDPNLLSLLAACRQLAGAAVRSSPRFRRRTGQCRSTGRERPCIRLSETGLFPAGRTTSSRTGAWFGLATCPTRPLPKAGVATKLASRGTTSFRPRPSRRQPATQPRHC